MNITLDETVCYMFTLKANEIKQIYVFIYTIDLEVKYVRLNSYQTEDKNNERNASDPVKKKNWQWSRN
jgi:hypothetical protein